MDSALYDSVIPQIYNWVIMEEVHSTQFIRRFMHVTLLFKFKWLAGLPWSMPNNADQNSGIDPTGTQYCLNIV